MVMGLGASRERDDERVLLSRKSLHSSAIGSYNNVFDQGNSSEQIVPQERYANLSVARNVNQPLKRRK